jgi:hypothetical protein
MMKMVVNRIPTVVYRCLTIVKTQNKLSVTNIFLSE